MADKRACSPAFLILPMVALQRSVREKQVDKGLFLDHAWSYYSSLLPGCGESASVLKQKDVGELGRVAKYGSLP